MILTRGTQIIYVPNHAEGDVNHPDCEEGFVTSVKGDVAFCRYWLMANPQVLRTKLCSEATPVSNLAVHNSVPQVHVGAALRKYCKPQAVCHPWSPSRLPPKS